MIWGGYSDYYGFGTEEFLDLCRKLKTEPLIVLAAPGTDPEQVQYAMDWVHYLNDPPTTEWGRLRAANGHPEPYGVRYFQIDNEPMNNGFTPEKYAEIVNVYGSRLRDIAPEARIVACGQKRSNDMIWSQKVIDLAGKNFDILGVHNYEYEPESYETRAAAHPRLPGETARLHPRFGAPADRDRRPGVEPLAHLRLARRTARGRQPDAVRGTQPRSVDDLSGAADAQHDGRSDLDVVHLPRPRLVVSRSGLSRSRNCSASTTRNGISPRRAGRSATSPTARPSSTRSRP